MGYRTEASIPRSWYLTRALALEGKIRIPTVVFSDPQPILESPPHTFVEQYRVRLDPRVSYGKDRLLAITLEGTEAPAMGLHVRSGVAEFVADVGSYAREPDASVHMPLEAWAGYYVGDVSLDELMAREDVVADDEAWVKGFFRLFDQVHPSKTALIPASASARVGDAAGSRPIEVGFLLPDSPSPAIDDD